MVDENDESVHELTVNNSVEVWEVLREYGLSGAVQHEGAATLCLEFYDTHEYNRARDALSTVDAWPDGVVPPVLMGEV
jgi:hypothetical protein